MITKKSIRVCIIFWSLFLIFASTMYFVPFQVSIYSHLPVSAEDDPNAFISIWNTAITDSGSSYPNQVRLPLISGGIYSFTVNWGDGSNSVITNWNQGQVTHTYAVAGVYTLTITGTIQGWQFGCGGDCGKIIEIQQWGCLRLGNVEAYFAGCYNLKLTAIDNLNLTGTTSLNEAFMSCPRLGNQGNMNGWDVSKVTDMSCMFWCATDFNQSIEAWNVSSVTNMHFMFCSTDAFNQPIGNWDVSEVTDMSNMFELAKAFNQPIGNWSISKVTDMYYMFHWATSFNQPIGDWDVSKVINMQSMFEKATVFNQPIGNWDVSNVITMENMFSEASAFNQSLDGWDVSNVKDMFLMFNKATTFNGSIGDWDVSNVTTMEFMFGDAISFNQPIRDWDVSNVITMKGMFYNATSFNQPIGNWIVSQVTTMDSMFNYATSFNQPIGDWNVSNVKTMRIMFDNAISFNQPLGTWKVSQVTNMYYMFYNATSFNQPIGDWDVSNVISMTGMFYNATSFDQPLGTWNVSKVSEMYRMFHWVTLSRGNYDHLLLGWSQLTLKENVLFDAGYSQYGSGAATIARQYIITTYEWIIIDGGQVLIPPIAPELQEIAGASTTGNITLIWNVVEGATSYTIYRDINFISSISGIVPIAIGINETIYQDTGLENGIYYYVIVAVNEAGNSSLSNCESVLVIITTSSSSSSSPTEQKISGYSGMELILSCTICLVLFVGIIRLKKDYLVKY